MAGAVFGLLSLAAGGPGGAGHAAPRRASWTSSRRASRARRARWPIQLVRILFPGTGLLVLSAWCLGVLNSHRRSSSPTWRRWCGTWRRSPSLVVARAAGSTRTRLATLLAWGVVAGSVLQFAGAAARGAARCWAASGPSLDDCQRRDAPGARAASSRSSSAAAWCRSAPTWTPPSPRSSRRERVSALGYAQTPLPPPGEPLRHGGLRGRAAGDVARETALGAEASARAARAHRPGPRAHRLLRGALGGGVPLPRGRGRRAPLPDGPVRRRGHPLPLVPPDGLGGGPGGRDAGAPLLLGLLRAQGHADAAAFASSGWRSPPPLAYVSVRYGPGWFGVPEELGAVGITATTGLAAWLEYLLLRRALARRIGRPAFPAGSCSWFWGSALAAGRAGAAGQDVACSPAGSGRPRRDPIRGWQVLPAPALRPILVAARAPPASAVVVLRSHRAGGASRARGRSSRRLRR